MADEPSIAILVHLYSVLRHRNGQIVDTLPLELPLGSRAGDALAALGVDMRLEPLLALNGDLAAEDASLANGDRLAIIPSVAGG